MAKVQIKLPQFHQNQQTIVDNGNRFNTVTCGRRFGKDVIQWYLHLMSALKGEYSAHIGPRFKTSGKMYDDMSNLFDPIIKKRNKGHTLEFVTGGIIDFWSLKSYDAIRGRKYHLTTLNEAAFSPYLQEAWEMVIRPTLSDYKGSSWFFSTPYGYNYYKELTEYKYDNWSHFKYTSYDNPFMDPSEFDQARFQLPELIFRQEYMAEFVDGLSVGVKLQDLQYYDAVDLKDLRIVMAVDLAISQKSTADYTVVCTLGKNLKTGNIYVLSVDRGRWTFNETINIIKNIAERFKPVYVGVEKVAYQAAMSQELIRQTNLPIKPLQPTTDKIARFQPTLMKFEQHLIYINKTITDDFKKELMSFPQGEHDDMVDALAYAVMLLDERTPVPLRA